MVDEGMEQVTENIKDRVTFDARTRGSANVGANVTRKPYQAGVHDRCEGVYQGVSREIMIVLGVETLHGTCVNPVQRSTTV